MRLLRFDSVGGASGDMILGALCDLGADIEALRRRLAALNVGPFAIEAEAACDKGIRGTRIRITIPAHDHPTHRRLVHIRDLLEGSGLPDRARNLALAVFTRLAEAEARVHGTTPDRIHFHEVGAVDSILDIAGSCLALDLLGVEAVRVGPLPDGTGTTCGSHGVLPIPVPAVAELLRGHAVIQTDEPFEMVTPTGAALLTGWEQALPAGRSGPAATISATGYGIGHRSLNGRANALRAILAETDPAAASPAESDACLVLETNLDDMTPELVGGLSTHLLQAGALDVYATAVQMKKQRPGTLLTVLCRPGDRERMLDALFAGSTTFGVREYTAARTVLTRRHARVDTPYGAVRIKLGFRAGRLVTRSPEYEDCLRAAAERGVTVRQVYEAAAARAFDAPTDAPPA